MAGSGGRAAVEVRESIDPPSSLTPREFAVLRLLAGGLTAAAIARALTISERTTHKHLQHLYRKLGVSDRLSAVLRAVEDGHLLPSTSEASGHSKTSENRRGPGRRPRSSRRSAR